MTISNAMAALRDEGLIQTRQGSPSIVIATSGGDAVEEVPEPSEEFQLISAQLQELRTVTKKISARLDDLDERTKHIGDD
jgi:DNA-binding FadR family transcriptional regulator